MTIAHKLSPRYDITIIHPAEFAPFPLNLFKKYRKLADNRSWKDGEITIHPFKYIRLFGKRIAFLLLPLYKRKIARYCKAYGPPTLVHAHFALPDGFFAYLLKQTLGIPYILSFRGSDVKLIASDRQNNTMKRMFLVLNQAQQIIVHNRAQQELLEKHGFNSVLMPHGIEYNFLIPKEIKTNANTINITSIGELIPQKHIDWVIKAVKDYRGTKKLSLKIAGEGPLKEALQHLSANHPEIQLLGKINHDRINELLCDSDIFALPSYNETFGLVYIEATAHQNAVIATKGTGIWGHFKEKEEMLYCDSYDSFQKMLYELIDNDALRNTIAKKAFEKTSTYFTWNKVIERYQILYDGLCSF